LFVKIDKNHKGMTKDEILGLAGSEKHLKKNSIDNLSLCLPHLYGQMQLNFFL